MLYLVGQLLIEISDARNHKHKVTDLLHSEIQSWGQKAQLNTDVYGSLITVQQYATYSVYYISVYRTVGTYRTIHMNQFQLSNESGL